MATPRRVRFVALTLAAAALLAACDGKAIEGLGSQPSTSASTSANGGGSNRQAIAPPAASGKVAEIDGNVVQVQNDETGQIAVKLTSKTTYTQTKSATRAAVTVGSCVFASSSTGSTGSAQPTAITASEVRVTPARNGQCGRSFGSGPSGPGRVLPSGAVPTGAVPSGAVRSGGTGRADLGSAIGGLVTKVSGATITVRADTPGSSTVTATITVTAKTKYTATVAATRSAVKVGLCMVAEGSTGSDGSVSASRVALSTATSDGCGQTFRRGVQGPAPGATR